MLLENSAYYYSIALMHGLDESRFAGQNLPSLAVAAIMTAIVIAGTSMLAVRKLRRMEVP